jgi:SAM-dependent methyltransferase
MQSTPLCEIMGHNKSDKGHTDIISSYHNYTTFYYSIFKNIRNEKVRVFELGLGTNNVNVPSNMGANGRPGASLYGWAEFFPNAQIFGADIDKDVLFNTDQIRTYYCDQTNKTVIQSMWETPALQDGFDILIDDGLHTFAANVCFFENSIHKLKSNGYYIIEDILKYEQHLFLDKIKEWESLYTDCTFTLIVLPSIRNQIDNTLLVIHRK